MIPDTDDHVEGASSLRIDQAQPRPARQGQAFLAQAVRLPDPRQPDRRFDLSFAARGELTGPLTVHIYVWDAKYVAQAIGEQDVQVTNSWARTTLTFDVPLGHEAFGVWLYLPPERGARLWIDDMKIALSGA
jgi:hypothetical protein